MNSPYYDYYYFIFKYSNRREDKKNKLKERFPTLRLRDCGNDRKMLSYREFVIPSALGGCPESFLLLYL